MAVVYIVMVNVLLIFLLLIWYASSNAWETISFSEADRITEVAMWLLLLFVIFMMIAPIMIAI